MARRHRPRRGSLGYSPRSRAARPLPRIRRWPAGGKAPAVQGFVGYKAGMTHALLVDYRKRSTTAGQELAVPVTVVEVPPLRVVGARRYRRVAPGRRVSAEVWRGGTADLVSRRIPPHPDSPPEALDAFRSAPGEEVRLVVHSRPDLVAAVTEKSPRIFEVGIGGGTVEERVGFALGLLGQELAVQDLVREGEFLDVIGVTKGFGFQGHVQRWGVKLQPHKNSKHRRMIGTLGPHNPSFVTFRIPQAGQTGYHRRTQHNLRVLRVIPDARKEPIVPAGGFPHYGDVRNGCLLFHGSIPGPARRLVRLRSAMRPKVGAVERVELRYLSVRSKQGA